MVENRQVFCRDKGASDNHTETGVLYGQGGSDNSTETGVLYGQGGSDNPTETGVLYGQARTRNMAVLSPNVNPQHYLDK